MLEFKPAVRKATPLLISIAGVSGSGKTFSALLIAAGLAGPDGKVGCIDTEAGRMSLYCDSPTIKKALPNGFNILQLDPPFSPERYIEAIKVAEKSGITVLCVDSLSHEWEGIGGACEIAEKNKLKGMPNWSKAKMEHKKFLNHCLSSPLHIVFCLRAREKVKILEVAGKTEVVPIGIQAIAEKAWVFEMLVSIMLEEHTHNAIPVKVPEPLVHLFPGGRPLTKEDGDKIREWNASGSAIPEHDQLFKRARAAAEQGMTAYQEFYAGLPSKDKLAVKDACHNENKATAIQADMARAEAATDEAPDGRLFPEPVAAGDPNDERKR